jgi:hypothetical protein
MIEVAEVVQMVEGPMVDVEVLQNQLKQLEPADLFKVLKVALAEAERKSKAAAKQASKPVKEKKEKKEKKVGSQPKGPTPPQLRQNCAWVNFIKERAQASGWESYEVTKQKEVIVMPGSVEHDGKHVFADSVTEKKPNGQALTHGNAMSLAAWTKKTKQEVYDEFLSTYEEKPEEEKEPVVKEPVVRKTAAEKEKEKEAKAEKALEEKKKKAEKREADKKEKAEKAEKEKAEKPAKEKKTKVKEPATPVKEEKAATPVKEEKPAKAEKPAKVKEEKAATPVKEGVAKKAPSAPTKAKQVVKQEEWKCDNDGLLHTWSFKGQEYLRNYDNEVFRPTADGQMGDWCGVYLPKENRIDDSVPAPEFDDE